jgi:hypothetical protein
MKTQVIKSLLAGAAVVVASVGLTSGAHAQSDKSTVRVEKPIRVKLGAYFTMGDNSDTLFSAGASYDFGKTKATNPLVYSAYADYYTKDGSSLWGLGGSVRGYFTPAVSATRVYGGLGLGAYIFDPDGGSTKTNFGGKLFAGVEFNQGFFGEIDYTYPGDSDADGIGASIGFRF